MYAHQLPKPLSAAASTLVFYFRDNRVGFAGRRSWGT